MIPNKRKIRMKPFSRSSQSLVPLACRSLFSYLAVFLALFGTMRSACSEPLPWMPPELSAAALNAGNDGGPQIIPEIVITTVPKAMSDASQYTRVYVLDLEAFGISNAGKDATATSEGINAALQHAKTLGANRIVFPKGTYLIDAKIPIVFDHKDTIVDLGGSTLQMETNGEPTYKIVQVIDGAENFRLTHGAIRGDRDTHDRETVKSSFEGCSGIAVISGKNMVFDHLEISKALGSGMTVHSMGNRTRPELLAMIMGSVRISDFESGGLSDVGKPVASNENMRTIKPFETAACKGAFEFGLGGVGYQGYPHIKGRVYQVFFYDSGMTFIEMKQVLQYKKVMVPETAAFMHFEINQPAFEGKPSTLVARITNFKSPTDVHVHDCRFFENRSLGMALGGGQKWLLENNVFDKNGPDIVGWGIDIEDGWELTQHIVFRNNIFKGNLKGDFVICSGSEMIFEGNTFESHVLLYGRPHNYIFRNNTFGGGRITFSTRTGIANIHDNTYENCSLAITFDTKAVADGLYRKPGETVVTPPLTLERETLKTVNPITGTYFVFNDSTFTNSHFVAGKQTSAAHFKNCTFVESSLAYEEEGPPVDFRVDTCRGTLTETGPGLARKKTAE